MDELDIDNLINNKKWYYNISFYIFEFEEKLKLLMLNSNYFQKTKLISSNMFNTDYNLKFRRAIQRISRLHIIEI